MSVSKANIKLVRSLQQKKFRDERGLFVAEGRKCVEELAKAFEQVLLFVEGENATAQEIEQMSSLRTPQGVIGVFRKAGETLPNPPLKGGGETVGAIAPQATYRGGERPTNELREEISAMARLPINSDIHRNRTSMGVIVALDGVQDPGNLGTIIRTCDWFGVRRLVCSHDTADCYNPKVVQATMGAVSRVNVVYCSLSELFATYKEMPVYGTLLDGNNIYETPLAQAGFIVMGNEGKGISEEIRRLVTGKLLIPSYPIGTPTSESLNVGMATAIVVAEFRRRTM